MKLYITDGKVFLLQTTTHRTKELKRYAAHEL